MRCHLWFCWRKSAGYVEIGFPGTPYFERIPYCEKHGKDAQQIIDQEEIVLTGKGKAKFTPKTPNKEGKK